MKKHGETKDSESDIVKTSLRLPRGVRDELIQAGEPHGRGMNDEILLRITNKPIHERLDKMESDIALMKSILIELRDR
jgi:hypothetical protein